jgi:hypothetical protein
MDDTKNNQKEYSPAVIKAVRSLIAQDANYQREFNYLALHPELMPPGGIDPGADPWQVFTLADAYLDRPPVEYIAAGLFPLPSLNIVYGAPGTYKSLIMADLSICVADGALWLPPAAWMPGATGFATKQAPVMWIDFDNGARPTHERFGALARARNLPPETPLYYYTLPMPWLDASKPESIGNLINRIISKGVQLVVIDNLGLISGGAAEGTEAMIPIMGALRQLAEATGAAIVVIHHQRKTGTLTTRAGETLRGHSSIEASLDLAILVEREEGSKIISLKSTKTRGVDVYPFSAEFTYTHKPNTTELETAKFWGLAVEDTTSDRAIEKAILDVLSLETLNQSSLVKAVKERGIPGTNRILGVIKRLENSKKIKAETGAKGAQFYEITG